MKEIKFRCWDGRCMLYFDLQDIEASDSLSHGKEFQLNDTLMQFTGLKDKNGKEIYEGDILQYTDNFNRPITGVVQYLGNGFWIEEKDETHYMPNDRETIGNIYENPELAGGTLKGLDLEG